MKPQFLTMIMSLTVFASTQVSADTTDLSSFNCGAQNIEIGMSSALIESNCSQHPVYVSKHERPALKKNKDEKPGNDNFEKWMYKASGQDATHVLIKNGKVIRIFTNTTRTASQ